MAAHQRHAGPSGGLLNALPDDALALCLAQLPAKERLRSAALVSTRFYRLCASIPLQLREFSAGLEEAESLALFLSKPGRSVRLQQASFCMCDDERGAAAVAAALTAAGAALESLELEEGPVLDAALPPGITRLVLWECAQDAMPPQVFALPNLRCLELGMCDYSAASMGGLPGLQGSLTRLSMLECCVPASLSTLSQLRFLELRDWPAIEVAPGTLNAALGQLSQLTALVLEDCSEVPPSIGGLSQLARLHCSCTREWIDEWIEDQLPAGPWLRSIRWLCITPTLLFDSPDQLAAMQGLQVVALADPWPEGAHTSPEWRSFWGWVATHPPLTHLHVDFFDLAEDGGNVELLWSLMDGVAGVLSTRPALRFSRQINGINSMQCMIDAATFDPVPHWVQ